MRVCQTCGTQGISELLVVCSKCHIISEHIYCLNKLAGTDDDDDDEEIEWACEFCEPRVIELSDSDTEGIELQDDAKEPLRGSTFEEARRVKNANADAGPSTKLRSFCREEKRSHNPIKKMHNNVVGDLYLPDEDIEATRARVSKSGSPETSSIPEDDCCSTIEPLPDPIWMGNFQIHGEHSCTVHGMMTHISNEACKEASEVTSSLPVLLRLEMVSKINIWPMKFKKMLPTVDNIAVYFFPDHRAERVYDYLVENIIDREFAMISRINNVELLIFSSCELPPSYWRLKRKYYLWGMFRRKKTLPQHRHDDSSSSNSNLYGSINHTAHSNLSNETGAKDTKFNTENLAILRQLDKMTGE